jgi:glycosyltransferase involved in cell wall biosynthesis
MKVLIYAPIFPPVVGGPATQGYHLCRVLAKRGDQPVVVTMGTRFSCSSPDGYPVYRYRWNYTRTPFDKLLRWVIFPFYFYRILRKEKPDMLHCNNVSALSFVAGRVARMRSVPSVIKYGGEWVWETLSSLRLRTADLDKLRRESLLARVLWSVERRGLSYFDCIWVPSESRAQGVEKILGHRRNVFVISNAMDLPPGGFHDLADTDPFIVATASRIIPHKRVPLIVKAFAQMNDPHARLVVIGIGGDLERAKEAAKEYGVETRVRFTGRLFGQTLYDELRQASVYVSASLEEGFPNVFVEALRFGLPIISSDVGGCREVVADGKSGLLFDALDEAALVSHLQTLDADRGLRNRMAACAFENSSKYDLNVSIEQFMEMYDAARRAHEEQ